MAKTALITGITGQDGAYLAELLLAKGYDVHGIKRRASSFNTDRIDHLYQDPHERTPAHPALRRPDGFDQPDPHHPGGAAGRDLQPRRAKPRRRCRSRARNTPPTPMRSARCGVLEAIRILGLEKTTRFYQASTSEMYGLVQETPQRETTPFYPRSPYGVAKVYAYWITVNYREAYGMYACNGILFNHESPIRGETFVSRKITRGTDAHQGRAAGLRCIWATSMPGATGAMRATTSGAVADAAAGRAGGLRDRDRRAALACATSSYGRRRAARHENRVARARASTRRVLTRATGRDIVRSRPALFPARGGRNAARRCRPRRAQKLGWTPEISFEELVAEMVESDLMLAKRDALVAREGCKIDQRT